MKKFRNYFFALFFVLVSVSLYAVNYQDVVYLKNGSVIKGMITEQVPNQSLTIETKDGSIFVFKMSEIIKITKEKAGEDDSGIKNKPEKNFALLINPLGFVQFGPQLDLEAKLIPDLYILGAFRMHSLGLLSYALTTDLTTAYAFGLGVRKFFREADTGDAFYIGLQEQYGINNSGISDSGSGNWTGSAAYLASALDVGYRWRTQEGFIFSLGVLAGLAPVLTDTWHYNNNPGTVYNNDLKTYLFGMLELEVGYEL
jgi:hypothetical protein